MEWQAGLVICCISEDFRCSADTLGVLANNGYVMIDLEYIEQVEQNLCSY